MRVASRVIGTLLIVCAFGIFASVEYGMWRDPGRALIPTWSIHLIFFAISAALALAGWSYLRYEPDGGHKQEGASKSTRFLIAHRVFLVRISQVGLSLSLGRAVLACFGSGWPGRWADSALWIGTFGLYYWARKMASPQMTDNSDWQRVPQCIRKSFPTTAAIALYANTVLFAIRVFQGRTPEGSGAFASGSHAIAALCVAVLYGVEAIYFAYGELMPNVGMPFRLEIPKK